MKALTVCQPYAELIARGEKLVENRTWPAHYRGPLLIHAGKSLDYLSLDVDKRIDQRYGIAVADMTFGAVIAKCRLHACVPIAKLRSYYLGLADHPHAEGPWCWILADVVRIPPVPWRGAQGLFEIDEARLASVAVTNRLQPPQVLNQRTSGTPPGAVYIGRGSKWGNPFRMACEADRAGVISQYETWLTTQPDLMDALPELRGRDLVCYCAPKACHGDVLLRLANQDLMTS